MPAYQRQAMSYALGILQWEKKTEPHFHGTSTNKSQAEINTVNRN